MSDDNNLLPLHSSNQPPILAGADLARVVGYAEACIAPSTRRAYAAAMRVFEAWCLAAGHSALPAHATVVAAFVADQAAGGRAVATIEKYVAAIGEAHRLTRQPVPTESVEVRAVLKGIRRTHGVAQKRKAPLLVAHLRRISSALPDNLLGVRDRALLLLGFAAALRRSELVALDLDDLEFSDEGLTLAIRRSKTDQQGAGRLVGVPYGSQPATCPVRSTRSWMDEASLDAAPLIRPVDRHGRIGADRLSAWSVGYVVKRAVALIGLDPTDFGGHSLRAGLATEAARAGAGEVAIMQQTGHKSVATLKGYIRHGSLFRNNAAALVGL